MPDAVEVRDLTRRFGEFTAVDRVNFTVGEGEIFGFLGPNGAGKTTTIRMLTALLAPSSGSGRVAGFDVQESPAEVKCRIGYMSQRFSLYDDLTVDENVRLFGGLYGVRGARLAARRAWALDMADLTHHGDRLTATLPLGWKQRLALGCALLHEPRILFLDEPTSGVDPIARRRFWELIDALAAGGTTALVSTHYMEEAEYCHRLALMNRGRVVALDAPSALRRTARDPILELETDNAPAAVHVLAGAPGVIDAAMFGRSVHVVVRDEEAARRELPAMLESAGRNCRRIHRIEPSLEDVFVSLIRGGDAEPAS